MTAAVTSSVVVSLYLCIHIIFLLATSALTTYWTGAVLSLCSLSAQCTCRPSHLWSDVADRRAGNCGSYSSVYVREIGRDKGEVTQRGTGSGRTEGGFSFHLHTIRRGTHALVPTNTLQYTPVIEIKLAKVTNQICISRSTTGEQQRKTERAGEI